MKMNIKFKVDGREVPLSRAGAEIEEAFKAKVSREIITRLSQVRCPIHGAAPKNIRSESGGGKMRWTFEACCAELERAAGKIIA